mmetsp:Transcript_38067/g.109474  ORF Transcript_38067/g.109474 Transcript_38067/m.109474 type:complete len:250 (-) Transcript_38067:188-937(-)
MCILVQAAISDTQESLTKTLHGSMLVAHARLLLDRDDVASCHLPHRLPGRHPVDPVNHALSGVLLDNRHGLLHVGLEALPDALEIIVDSAARRAPRQQPLLHRVLVRLVEQHAKHLRTVADDLLPNVDVAQVAGEAVDEEVCLALLARLGHGLLQEADRDLRGHDLAFLDDAVDQLTVLGIWVLALRPQAVARRDVPPMAEALADHLALRPFARTRAAEDEQNLRLLCDCRRGRRCGSRIDRRCDRCCG